MCSAKSFTKMMNKSGPNLDPGGTPYLTIAKSDKVWLIFILCVLPVRYDLKLNHETEFSVNPAAFSFISSILSSTESNAFLHYY